MTPLYPVFAESTSAATLREKAQARLETKKENIASREADRKAKFTAFKDKKKAEAATRIDENLTKINQKRTSMMTQKLNSMEDILAKLNSFVATSKSDTTAAKADISSAVNSVNNAKSAVSAQSVKTYTISSTTEGKVKDEAQALRKQLFTDLETVHQQVVSARKSVSTAISTTRSSLGGNK